MISLNVIRHTSSAGHDDDRRIAAVHHNTRYIPRYCSCYDVVFTVRGGHAVHYIRRRRDGDL